MQKSLYPFVISLVLIGVLQLIGFNRNNYPNDVFIKKNANDVIRKEMMSYAENFNPDLIDSIANGRIDTASDTLDQAGPVFVTGDMYRKFNGLQLEYGSGGDRGMIDYTVIGAYRKLGEMGGKAGYIRINNFRIPAYSSFMSVMEKLAGNIGLDTLYLDLRNCGNGVDVEVAKIANQLFIQEGNFMMEANFYNGSHDVFKSTGKVFFPLKYIYVILNDKSSGIAVLLARILKNNGITTIVGDGEFTIPAVIRHFPLSDGNYVRMPVGRYRFDAERGVATGQSSELKSDLIMDAEGIDGFLSGR